MSKLKFRDEKGLMPNVEYDFNQDGTINWRSMVGSEHLFPNRGWFESRNKPVPNSIEGLNDTQLLIKLSGIKEVAKLRGYNAVSYNVIKCEKDYVATKCAITWSPNYESDYQEIYYEDMANATIKNTSDFAVKFLETIAANRAFVRAVRNFLNIHIVGSDEIDTSKKGGSASFEDDDSETSLPSSQAMLQKIAKGKGYSNFDEFKDFLRDAWKHKVYQNDGVKTWTDFDDISAKEARILISILNSK